MNQLIAIIAAIAAAISNNAGSTKKVTTPPPVTSPSITSNPVKPPATPASTSVSVSATAGTQPRDMKLLVIGIDGTEPSYQAITTFLNYLGIPYQSVLAASQPLPTLATSSKGLYQGIILSTGNLSTGTQSALSAASWSALDDYMRTYKVRLAAFYAWPEARYGLSATSGFSASDAAPQYATLTSAGASLFSYLNANNQIKITGGPNGAWMYLAVPGGETGDTVTSLVTVQNQVVMATDTKADGREYLAMTIDSNPYLGHALALNYGIFNWVTKGIFVGARKIYFTPQMDDFFLSNDQYVQGVAACTPGGFTLDPTYDPGTVCPDARMSAQDLDQLIYWQDSLNAQTQFKSLRVALAFNGFGSGYGGGDYPKSDQLTAEAQSRRAKFNWISHTFDHEDLDCYAPAANSGICYEATQAQSLAEISNNVSIANKMGLSLDRTSMVTPGISGLANAAFLTAAQRSGIKYLVGDSSRVGGLPTAPNTGIRNTTNNSILVIPRRPVNVFYNTSSGLAGVSGSLVDEYNYFYGPSGMYLVNGAHFFNTEQTLADIVNRESDNLLQYMMSYEIYPNMWHQSNFIRYSGTNSLFTDVAGSALSKFAKLSNLPVVSLAQTDIGKYMEDRMAFLTAGVTATLTPGLNIAITGTSAASVPITGICQQTCESYGGQKQSKIAIKAGTTVTVPAQ